MEMNGKNADQIDVEKGGLEESKLVQTEEPRRFSFTLVNTPSPDYMKWSMGSLFLCLCWGILALIASNKTRKYNNIQAYKEAAHYSHTALRHNKSAVACCVVLILIVGLPLAISLAVQGSISKYSSVREFFG